MLIFASCGDKPSEESTSDISASTSESVSEKSGDESSKEETSQPETDFVPVIRFAVASDTHISDSGNIQARRFRKLFSSAYAYAESCADYSKLDAVIVAGDMTNQGMDYEYDAFNSVASRGLKEGTLLLTVMGNHEFVNENGAEVYLEKSGSTYDKHEVINGIHFIGISASSFQNSSYSSESLTYLENELAAAAEDGGPDKPIIVFMHHHIKDTVYVSSEWYTDSSAPLKRMFNKYPQVIFFSGHSHGPVNNPTSIWQGGFTALGTGTLSYFEMASGMTYGTIPPEATSAAQYYIVEISADNRVRIMPYDLITDSFFKTPSNIDDPEETIVYYIDSSKDTSLFRYKDRASTADTPYFASGAAIEISDIIDCGARITFPQALDGDCIYSYSIECTSADGGKVNFAYFSEYYLEPMPDTLSFAVSGLKDNTEYEVAVTPVDCYGIKGEPIKASFTTDKAEEVVYTSKNPVNFYGTFTNFDSVTELTRSPSTPAYGGQISGDIFAGEWADGTSSDKARFEIAEGKGYNGSACLGVWAEDDDNRGLYIFATEENGNSTAFSDISYLRVWVDFTDVTFRKANFGLVSEQGALFTTDEEDGRNDQYFWYLPEGSTTWRKYVHGDDGCFGDVQDSDVSGFKGWMAFPISDFTYRQDTGSVNEEAGTPYYSKHIAGVYMFWDYSEIDSSRCTGNKFYLDEIAIVADYTVFDEYPS